MCWKARTVRLVAERQMGVGFELWEHKTHWSTVCFMKSMRKQDGIANEIEHRHSYCLYAVFCLFCFHCTNWNFSLTEVFCAFSLVVRQIPEYSRVFQSIPRKDRARSVIFLISEMCFSVYCLCLFCCSMNCLCVNVYCTSATGCQPNCS